TVVRVDPTKTDLTARLTARVSAANLTTTDVVCVLPKSPATVVRVHKGHELHSGESIQIEDSTSGQETDSFFGFDLKDNTAVQARFETRAPGKSLPFNQIRLDAIYDKVTPGSFIVIERASPPATFTLDNPLVARVESVSSNSVTDYGMPATKVTVLTLDRPWLTDDDKRLSDIRDVTVYLQSEELVLDGEPYDADIGPVAPGDPNGATIDLDGVYDGLPAGRLLIVAGERTDTPGATGVAAAELVALQASSQVLDQQNTPGQGYPHTRLVLTGPLANSYQRGTVTIYGNVVAATQGETRTEILGAGQAGVPNQGFTLKQSPLTYLPAPTPTGAEPQLQVRVNGVLWARADDFNQLGPNDRAYVLESGADGKTSVRFGDGVRGARLPTGTDNVRATYRNGAGSSGNLDPGDVNQLASRPLGVKAVTNPLPAAGGADLESTDQARRNAPVGLGSLGRLVSVDDYQDFARAYAGIAKVRSVRLTDGTVQRVHVTVAGPDGGDIPSSTDLYKNLVQALTLYGDPSLPLTVASRGLQFLVIGASIRVAGGYEFDAVADAVRAELAAEFGFDNRDFAQPVYLSDVISTIQDTPGVAAVLVLYFGTVAEKTGGQLTPLDTIAAWLKDITDPSKTSAGATAPPDASPPTDDGSDAEPAGLPAGANAKPPQPVLTIPDTRFDAATRTITPAEIAFLTPRVPDLLTLVEWTP
ncbi:MAG TPA: putative baseplate assembly protein, partial [Urbifossiella sp.]|nr:putative baseplate assembly protein [Urbifossiella sp.]